MNKTALIETLHDWITQRPGLEPANYMRGWNDTAGRSAYRSDARSITKDLHDARYLLDYIAIRDSITAERILEAAKHSFSGRLSITPDGDGFKVDYCTGQYWPTEYRPNAPPLRSYQARCGAIWDWLREGRQNTDDADTIRKAARREFPANIARRWFQLSPQPEALRAGFRGADFAP
jgi:hypothetical protein